MHQTLIELFGIRVTGWKIIGYAGVFLFSARWFVQLWASRRAQRPVLPTLFWLMSLVGSLLCLAYFVFGKNDSVGILAYLFPALVSLYNLRLELAHRRQLQTTTAPEPASQLTRPAAVSGSAHPPNRAPTKAV